MIKHILLLILFTFLFISFRYYKNNSENLNIKIKEIAKGFTSPVAMDCPKDKSGRLFVCEQTGKIKIISNGRVLEKPFLDVFSLLDKVNKVYSEKGLLGIAFHPNYKSNGRFFIYYSAPEADKGYDNKSVLAEFKVSDDSNVADPASQKIILEIKEPESNHNGGQLAFGPDGFLYMGVGDGGGAGDKHGTIGNAQDLTSLLGKILRIDVDSKSPYSIPENNPYTGKNMRKEIWAYGLRNPWRFSFDPETKRLFCGDVGQNKWEEIDIIKKGKNYGWRIMEGNHCYNPENNCDEKNLELPIAEYSHKEGISVIGGFVYGGSNAPSATGKYIFGDWKGNMFYLEENEGKWDRHQITIEEKKTNNIGMDINSFGTDENGELYILCQKPMGTIFAGGSVYLISGN